MDIEKSIAVALGVDFESSANTNVEIIPPGEKKEVATVEERPIDLTSEAQEDFEFARTTMRQLIGDGITQLNGAANLAQQIDKPSAYEAYANLLDKISAATKDLYDLHKKKKDLSTPVGRGGIDDSSISIDKAVFVGTTAELLKKKKELKKQQE